HFQEIRGIPPNLKEFSALNCKSLSQRGTSVLLNQQVHEGKSTHFVMPGESIPRWFEWCSSGPSISFWFRGTEFPSKSLCIAILLKHDIHSPPLQVKPIVTINGNQVSHGFGRPMDQMSIFNMNKHFDYKEIHFERGWNHAKLSYKVYGRYLIAKEMGMHILKQESSSTMEDIRFTDPYKMTQVIIMMIMLSTAFPNHKKQPLLL
ncbi:hypothetical protein HN51_008379, partial [Arachis hypogaea]